MGFFFIFKIVRKIVAAILGLAVLLIAIPLTTVVYTSRLQDTTPADAVLVFGAAQFDGEPSPVLRNRLDHALKLYDLHRAERIVTVGGKRAGDRFTEAAAGRDYLRGKGVPRSRITAIGVGDDTYHSAAAVASWARKAGVTSLIVVTDRAHMARAVTIVKSFDLNAYPSSPQRGPGSTMTWQYVSRETLGLLRFWFLKDGDMGTTLRNALHTRLTTAAG